jgi:hypothetical protein
LRSLVVDGLPVMGIPRRIYVGMFRCGCNHPSDRNPRNFNTRLIAVREPFIADRRIFSGALLTLRVVAFIINCGFLVAFILFQSLLGLFLVFVKTNDLFVAQGEKLFMQAIRLLVHL